MAAKRKYCWEEWFGVPRTVLVRGIDYLCSQSTMCGMIRNNASQRGMRVRVVDRDDTIVIEVVGGEIHNPDKIAVAQQSPTPLAAHGQTEAKPERRNRCVLA